MKPLSLFVLLTFALFLVGFALTGVLNKIFIQSRELLGGPGAGF